MVEGVASVPPESSECCLRVFCDPWGSLRGLSSGAFSGVSLKMLVWVPRAVFSYDESSMPPDLNMLPLAAGVSLLCVVSGVFALKMLVLPVIVVPLGLYVPLTLF